ncbi:hypothetical protein ABZT08_29015 [Streptomyces sp. NPDC005526]|uniref:hypothetical protein n=1 Tax=Streptomyces sp. NPDC005526 TaxID=3156885 RepID=UPI0033B94632
MTTSPDRQRPPLPPAADQPVLTLRFTASPRGARLARRLASQQMDAQESLRTVQSVLSLLVLQRPPTRQRDLRPRTSADR